MTHMVAIDESGDTGKDSRFFTMAAVATVRPRLIMAARKAVLCDSDEFKFYKAEKEDLLRVLNAISSCPIDIISVTVDKHDYSSKCYGIYGNKLYKMTLEALVEEVFRTVVTRDVNVYVDSNTFISQSDLRKLVDYISLENGHNVKRCEKVISQHNKCIQLADVVAGSINRFYENGDGTYISVISKKISVARKL